MNISALVALNAARWARARITRGSAFDLVAHHLVKEKATYQKIEAATGVPWFVIAVIHEREASQDFTKSIAQGDAWNRISIHVPKGRGPFKSFYDAAIDALTNCGPYAAKWKDWSPGGTLSLLEQYNGLGYYAGPVTKKNGVVVARYPSQSSPYIWAGTSEYAAGKYARDGVFDPHTVDTQLGCAGLILAMQQIDPSITFGDKAHVDTHVVIEQHPAAPAKTAPAPAPAPKTPVVPKAPLDVHKSAGSFLNTLYTLVQGFLKRKS